MFDSIMVLKFLDGSVMKGFGSVISPGEAILEFKDLEEKIHWVELKKVKGAFYVKSFEGTGVKAQAGRQTYTFSSGQKVRVTFKDGETMEGFVNDVTRLPQAAGFYVVPADPVTNNIRVWVNREAVQGVLHIINPLDEKKII
jgi:hypothetical protein